MLLPSPIQATVLPSISPRCSRKVCISASSWQGWYSSVSALMTGTWELAANSVTSSWLKVRIITTSTMLEITRAPVGDRLAAAQLGIARRQEHGVAAELSHTGFEGYAGTGR